MGYGAAASFPQRCWDGAEWKASVRFQALTPAKRVGRRHNHTRGPRNPGPALGWWMTMGVYMVLKSLTPKVGRVVMMATT